MKLSKLILKKLIKEELQNILKEIRYGVEAETIQPAQGPFEGDQPPNTEKYTALWELITKMNDPGASYEGSKFNQIAQATKGPDRQVTNASYLMEKFLEELDEIMRRPVKEKEA